MSYGKTHKLLETLLLHVWGEGKGGGGVTQERIPNFSNNQFFQAEKLPEKPCQQVRVL